MLQLTSFIYLHKIVSNSSADKEYQSSRFPMWVTIQCCFSGKANAEPPSTAENTNPSLSSPESYRQLIKAPAHNTFKLLPVPTLFFQSIICRADITRAQPPPPAALLLPPAPAAANSSPRFPLPRAESSSPPHLAPTPLLLSRPGERRDTRFPWPRARGAGCSPAQPALGRRRAPPLCPGHRDALSFP